MTQPIVRHGLFIAALFATLVGCGALSAQPPVSLRADFGDASLRGWVQPIYPDAAKKAKEEGQVEVEFVVGTDGRVSQAAVKETTDEVFNEAALAAVRRWTFEPAVEDRKPAATGMGVTVVFQLAQLKQKQMPVVPPPGQMPHGLKISPAKFIAAPDPDYPAELEARKLPGEVQIEFTVDAEGAARSPKVLWASHAAFIEMALRALEKTKFQPARQGLLTKATTMQYPVEFASVGTKRAEILEANQITIVGETKPGVEPTPFVLIEPVYPREHLLAGEVGTATAEFSLIGKGGAEDATIVSASAPEYGASLLAAIQAWSFKPASTDGVSVPVRLRVVYDFVPPSVGNGLRLLEALRPGGAGVGGPAGLDQKLKPLWRGFPVYPAALREEQLKGSAEIEFIIDREGRARFPRVKSATREEFGWAAATAISQWVFERPTRKGEPVDITVTIPVSFNPPKP